MTRVERVAIVSAALIGITAGLGAFTFVYAKGASYLGHDPAACANCHVMQDYYDAWLKGSHRVAAGCNDCHTPHNLVGKYAVKAKNGFWHSFYFTTGRYPDPIRITAANRRVTERACRDCHEDIVAAITPPRVAREASAPLAVPAGRDEPRAPRAPAGPHTAPAPAAAPSLAHAGDASLSCIRCHQTVGHWVR